MDREKRISEYLDSSSVPDRCEDADESISDRIYWDEIAGKPFRIHKDDPAFCRKMKVPLPYTYYTRRLQENFKLIPFSGTLRLVACGKCGINTETSWPGKYDGRILCEKCYLKEVY